MGNKDIEIPPNDPCRKLLDGQITDEQFRDQFILFKCRESTYTFVSAYNRHYRASIGLDLFNQTLEKLQAMC